MSESDSAVGDEGEDTATPPSPRSPRSALAALRAIPEPDLSGLQQPRRRRQKPGQWDGRVEGLSLKEYRDLKWGTEAGYKMTTRGGPKYTIRRRIMTKSESGPQVLLKTDFWKSYHATQPSAPSYSAGRRPVAKQEPERSPGPYALKPLIGSNSHPTIPKDLGRQFGRERLLCNDAVAPAPGDYDVSGYELSGRYLKQPNYQIQGREAWREPPEAPGPGVGDYQYDDIFRNGKHTSTRWSIQGKVQISKPGSGQAGARLRKRLDAIKKTHQFEKEIDFGLIAPLLLALDTPQWMEVCKELEDNASSPEAVKDPNRFLTSAALSKLGSGGGHGARKPGTPGPGHYGDPAWPDNAGGAGMHGSRFGKEHRGLVT